MNNINSVACEGYAQWKLFAPQVFYSNNRILYQSEVPLKAEVVRDAS